MVVLKPGCFWQVRIDALGKGKTSDDVGWIFLPPGNYFDGRLTANKLAEFPSTHSSSNIRSCLGREENSICLQVWRHLDGKNSPSNNLVEQFQTSSLLY